MIQFQSQVAILFGGYDVVVPSKDLVKYVFQSQVAILFGGYSIHLGYEGECLPVSIAGGDSFWGLRCYIFIKPTT